VAIVNSTTTINAPLEKVYAIAQDVEKFPDYMPNVKSLEIVERDGNRVVTKWVGEVEDLRIKIRWTEEDIWDSAAKTCTFRQLEGDYKTLRGIWRFADLGDGTTRFDSELEIEYDVPLIGPLIKGLIAKKAKQNLDQTLAAIKRAAES
jgi:ribosome-associated toxin RatA of RatAB toxin-antitoxin module